MTDAQLDLRDPRWNESQTALDDHAGEHPEEADDDWEEQSEETSSAHLFGPVNISYPRARVKNSTTATRQCQGHI
jgi:hypothetical protein